MSDIKVVPAHLQGAVSLKDKVARTQAELVKIATAMGQDPNSRELWKQLCTEKARLVAYSRFM